MTVKTPFDASKDPLIGQQLGDYRLTSLLASGGMARIYRGIDHKLQRHAAVKVLLEAQTQDDYTLAKRFQREARSVAALEHDNIITIYQYGEYEGAYFLAMKLVKGKDLAQELKRLKRSSGRMDIGRGLRILEQVASALDYAHVRGIVHRDIKPSNILLDEDDKAILTDFGLVMRLSAETTLGTAFGTPRYIAPEQALASNKAVPQSDIYALAVILYEVLTGETPFNGDTPMQIALSHIGDPPPPPRTKNPEIPQAVEDEILRALEKEPERRHGSAGAFIRSIKKGYGEQTSSATLPDRGMDMPVTAHPVSVPAPKPPPTDHTPVTAKPAWMPNAPPAAKFTLPLHHLRGRRGRMAAALGAVLLVMVLALLLMGRGGTTVTLVYNDTNFVMRHDASFALNVFALQFVRGQDGQDRDDYAGDRVKGDQIPAGECLWLYQPGSEAAKPAGCDEVQSAEQLPTEKRFFWRAEDVNGENHPSFEVRYNRQVIATCATVSAGAGNTECRFAWPVSTADMTATAAP